MLYPVELRARPGPLSDHPVPAEVIGIAFGPPVPRLRLLHPAIDPVLPCIRDRVLFGLERQAHLFQGVGGADRLIYTEGRDAFVAKNRFDMESELWLDGGPSAAWPALWAAITRKEIK